MNMYRKVSEYLRHWKDSTYRKPLLIQGARQVGKTYAVLEFGRQHYDNVAYFNFQTSKTIYCLRPFMKQLLSSIANILL